MTPRPDAAEIATILATLSGCAALFALLSVYSQTVQHIPNVFSPLQVPLLIASVLAALAALLLRLYPPSPGPGTGSR